MKGKTRNPGMLLVLIAVVCSPASVVVRAVVPAMVTPLVPAVVPAAMPAILPNGNTKNVALQTQPAIVVLNYYYARPGQAEAVYLWRMHASDVREKLGLPRGRVLKRTPGPEAPNAEDLPDVVWQCEYPNAQARARDVARLSESEEFAAVEKHMDTLIRRFRRELFNPEPTP